jgi:putative tricarboxylic transport membrane protein
MTDPNAGLGAGAVPLFLGVSLVLVGVGLVSEALRGVPFASQEAEDVAVDRPPSYRALTLSASAAFLPLVSMRSLGFVATGTACFALVAAAFGSRRHAIDLLIGATLSLACWWGFGALGIDLGAFVPLFGS